MSERHIGYVKDNKILFAIGAYFAFSVALKILTGTDICIPCLWKTAFDVECPGCGLTTSLISVLRLDFDGAYENNPLIFIIAPLIVFFIIKDYRRFILQ